MVELSIANGTVTFELQGLHRLWALKSRITVPLSHVRAARADPTVKLGWWKGWRLPGTHVPGLIVAGTYYQGGRCIFWDVVRPAGTIVVELTEEPYDELVVEVMDPGAAVALLEAARRPPAAPLTAVGER